MAHRYKQVTRSIAFLIFYVFNLIKKLLLTQSAISDGKHPEHHVTTVFVVHLDVELSIGCHGKPHVLRVATPCQLLVDSKTKEFAILLLLLLSVNLDKVVGGVWAGISNIYNSIHQDLFSSRGNHTWDGEGNSTSLSEVDDTKMSCGYRCPGNRIATVATRKRRPVFL